MLFFVYFNLSIISCSHIHFQPFLKYLKGKHVFVTIVEMDLFRSNVLMFSKTLFEMNANTLMETAGCSYKLQACMQGIFEGKPRKSSKHLKRNFVGLHCSFHYSN